MPIKSIQIVIEPAPNQDKTDRILTFLRETKQWVSNEGGFFSGEIALMNAINKIRNDIVV